MFFYLWHKRQSQREKSTRTETRAALSFAGFCIWGWMKEVIRMMRQRDGQRHGQGGEVTRRIWGGGWRSHYGGILPKD
ncbi:hypothetical protein BC440_00630 [Thalassospira sp. MIT1004]|nr:hypothetical protein [Thalassospira sp.]OHZ03105.1 hypothetical protein BC440_00630 [Thalassospira sp. MIT1004]